MGEVQGLPAAERPCGEKCGHDGLDIIGLGQGVHVHVVIDHQQAAFQIGTGKSVVLHFLDTAVAGGIPHEPFQHQPIWNAAC